MPPLPALLGELEHDVEFSVSQRKCNSVFSASGTTAVQPPVPTWHLIRSLSYSKPFWFLSSNLCIFLLCDLINNISASLRQEAQAASLRCVSIVWFRDTEQIPCSTGCRGSDELRRPATLC